MDPLDFLSSLEVLDLSNNQIMETNAIQNMPKLRELYLAKNRIKSFDSFEGLPELQVLHLRDNNILGCADELNDLPMLWYLNVRKNLIGKIDDILKFKSFDKLKVLIVDSNPFAEKFVGGVSVFKIIWFYNEAVALRGYAGDLSKFCIEILL